MDSTVPCTCPPPDPKTQPKITDFFPGSVSPASKSKKTLQTEQLKADAISTEEKAPKKRGRPRKTDRSTNPTETPTPTRKRGRPRKDTVPEDELDVTGVEEMSADVSLEEATALTTLETPQKKRRRSFTAQKKQEVVEYAKKYSLYKASLHYQLSCGTIGPWMKKDFSKMDVASLRASGSGRKLTYPPKLESELAQYILEQRDIKPSISTQEIIDYACALIQPSCPEFKGTRGWFQKFLVRNSLLSPENEPLSKKLPPPLEEKISVFLEKVKQARTEHSHPLELIGNMDEVRVHIDMASNRKKEKSKTMVFPTYTVGNETQSYTLGAEKQHITVVMTALANGQLLPPMIIFKGVKTPKDISMPSGWLICVQESGHLDSSLMDLWMKEIWLKHTRSRKALLIMDCCHPHLTENYTSTLEEGNTTVLLIPPGCSSKLQPVVASLAAPLKNTCSKLCSEFYQLSLSCLKTPGDRLKSAVKEDICPWLITAFKRLTKKQDIVAQSFKATGLTLAPDGSEEYMYRVDCPREEFEMVQNESQGKEASTAVETMAEPSGVQGVVDIGSLEELDHSLDNSLKTLYNYVLQMQSKPLSDSDMQLLEEHLRTQ